MTFNLYAIKDELSEYHPGLMPFEEDAQAKRWFRDHVRGNSMMMANPQDFSIWKVAVMDSKTGILTGLKMPELVERAKGEKNGNEE